MTGENLRIDMLERLRPRVEARDRDNNILDGEALLEAISTAATLGLAMPTWLASAVTSAIASYRNSEARTLDEAFCLRRKKGQRQHAAQSEGRSALYVIAEVLRLRAQGESMDAGIFEAAGAACGVGKTTAEKWFYKHKNARTDIYLVAKQMAGVSDS